MRVRGAEARHPLYEDILALIAGVVLPSTGVYILAQGGLVTGGTAGVALLISYTGVVPFGIAFAVINLPFFVLAWITRGPRFTVLSAVCIVGVASLPSLGPLLLGPLKPNLFAALLIGNLLAGVGILILFRHGASLGGFNVVALLAQDRLGIRAGWVLLTIDTLVILASLFVSSPLTVLASAAGAVVLNAVLAFNHRPGRYSAVLSP
ncbi:YitT family protein [Microbacterium ureisolvens]|uniref:YitT family protein n=1 Tax=Microbacterium ureisolvens TaxID=2781186 RepID=A0ABS7I1H7_9MICO|nr:YitT family protein [Microbacterium ureisolvens]MBW9110671.1 YitT family protein [Microbacterium ureisolvens]